MPYASKEKKKAYAKAKRENRTVQERQADAKADKERKAARSPDNKARQAARDSARQKEHRAARDIITEKRCEGACGLTRPVSSFPKDNCVGGFGHMCYECTNGDKHGLFKNISHNIQRALKTDKRPSDWHGLPVQKVLTVEVQQEMLDLQLERDPYTTVMLGGKNSDYQISKERPDALSAYGPTNLIFCPTPLNSSAGMSYEMIDALSQLSRIDALLEGILTVPTASLAQTQAFSERLNLQKQSCNSKYIANGGFNEPDPAKSLTPAKIHHQLVVVQQGRCAVTNLPLTMAVCPDPGRGSYVSTPEQKLTASVDRIKNKPYLYEDGNIRIVHWFLNVPGFHWTSEKWDALMAELRKNSKPDDTGFSLKDRIRIGAAKIPALLLEKTAAYKASQLTQQGQRTPLVELAAAEQLEEGELGATVPPDLPTHPRRPTRRPSAAREHDSEGSDAADEGEGMSMASSSGIATGRGRGGAALQAVMGPTASSAAGEGTGAGAVAAGKGKGKGEGRASKAAPGRKSATTTAARREARAGADATEQGTDSALAKGSAEGSGSAGTAVRAAGWKTAPSSPDGPRQPAKEQAASPTRRGDAEEGPNSTFMGGGQENVLVTRHKRRRLAPVVAPLSPRQNAQSEAGEAMGKGEAMMGELGAEGTTSFTTPLHKPAPGSLPPTTYGEVAMADPLPLLGHADGEVTDVVDLVSDDECAPPSTGPSGPAPPQGHQGGAPGAAPTPRPRAKAAPAKDWQAKAGASCRKLTGYWPSVGNGPQYAPSGPTGQP